VPERPLILASISTLSHHFMSSEFEDDSFRRRSSQVMSSQRRKASKASTPQKSQSRLNSRDDLISSVLKLSPHPSSESNQYTMEESAPSRKSRSRHTLQTESIIDTREISRFVDPKVWRAPWFLALSRQPHAHAVLRAHMGNPGAFVIYESTEEEHEFVLSFVFNGRIHDLNIDVVEGSLCLQGSALYFSDLLSFVEFFTSHVDKSIGCKLDPRSMSVSDLNGRTVLEFDVLTFEESQEQHDIGIFAPSESDSQELGRFTVDMPIEFMTTDREIWPAVPTSTSVVDADEFNSDMSHVAHNGKQQFGLPRKKASELDVALIRRRTLIDNALTIQPQDSHDSSDSLSFQTPNTDNSFMQHRGAKPSNGGPKVIPENASRQRLPPPPPRSLEGW
jgi:hypothetical protein